jgi:DNA ligase-1
MDAAPTTPILQSTKSEMPPEADLTTPPFEGSQKRLKSGTGAARAVHECGPACVCEPLVGGGDRAGGALCQCNPFNPKWGECPLAEDEVVIVHGDHGTDYELKMPKLGGIYCSCPAWRWRSNSEFPAQVRICKHGEKLLTDAFGAGKGKRIAQQWQAQGMERLGETFVIKRERPEEIARKEREQQDKLAAMKLPKVDHPYAPQPEGLPTPTPPADGAILGEYDIALANDLSSKEPLDQYVWSEKLDGVRAYWNGTNAFGSKMGKPLNVPAEIVDLMPKGIQLDGKLYARGTPLSKINGILRRKAPKMADWQAMGLQYHVFDSPFVQGDFSARVVAIKSAVGEDNPFVKVVEYKPIESEEQLNADFVRIVESGGEGLMLRLVRGVYRAGRTSDLLKIKDIQYDEAIVIQDNDPTDSVRCRLRSGVEFNISCDGAKHPAVGRVLVTKYKCLNPSGAPREPKYVGLCRRIDVDASQFP